MRVFMTTPDGFAPLDEPFPEEASAKKEDPNNTSVENIREDIQEENIQESLSRDEIWDLVITQLVVSYNLYRSVKTLFESIKKVEEALASQKDSTNNVTQPAQPQWLQFVSVLNLILVILLCLVAIFKG